MFEQLEKVPEERAGSARKVNFYDCVVSEDLAELVTHSSPVLLSYLISIIQCHLILFTAQLVL